ncbi:MAG: hypothetical protein QXL15_03555, partial [Candidatus Korarchaeota archaeon]
FFLFGLFARVFYFYYDILMPGEDIFHMAGVAFTIMAFVPLFAIAEKDLIKKTKGTLTLICAVIGPLVFINGLLGFAYGPFVLITLGMFVRFFQETEGYVKRMSLIVIIGFILYGFGYSIGAEVFAAFDYPLKSTGLITMAVGNIMIAYGLNEIGSLSEFYWRGKIISYHIIDKSSHLPFIDLNIIENVAEDKSLLTNVLSGINKLLDEISEPIKDAAINVGTTIVKRLIELFYSELRKRYSEDTVQKVLKNMLMGMKMAITAAMKAEKVAAEVHRLPITPMLEMIGVEINIALKQKLSEDEFKIFKKPGLVIIFHSSKETSHFVIAKEDLKCIKERVKKVANDFEAKYINILKNFRKTGEIKNEDELRSYLREILLR